MVFNQNLVAVIKSKGKILRETGNNNDTVYIPFGSEYSILLKNLNTVKALVNVEVDGREAISGLIVHPNSDVELERFFEGDMKKGHKFKFIEKTDDIKEHRGDKPEDGIVRITYQFEAQFCNFQFNQWTYFDNSDKVWPRPDGFNGTSGGPEYYGGSTLRSNTFGDSISNYSCNVESNVESFNNMNDEGITVEGNYSEQSFVHGSIGTLEGKEHCINIQLKGHFSQKEKVKKPLTTKMKMSCNYCGKRNFSKNKFCPNCGAALI